MKGRFVTLFAAALVSMTSAGACGGVQEELEKRAQEEVKEERRKAEKSVQEKVQEEQQRVDEEVKKAQK
jgi:hypothetical protein